MKLKNIIESQQAIQIVRWDEMAEEYDPWVVADEADQIARESNIRISRDKELTFIALDGDTAVGAIWSSLLMDDDDDWLVENNNYAIFNFDVAVKPSNRGGQIGLRLIDAAIEEYRDISSSLDQDVIIKVWVVNPKLVRVLENKYGFEISQGHGDGSAHMTHYGN